MKSETRMPAALRRRMKGLELRRSRNDIKARLSVVTSVRFSGTRQAAWGRCRSDLQHLLGRCHLEIERKLEVAHQPRDILVANMPAIFAQMRGNTIRARLLRQQRRAHRIGMPAATRVAHGGDMIDVDAEAERLFLDHRLSLARALDRVDDRRRPARRR